MVAYTSLDEVASVQTREGLYQGHVHEWEDLSQQMQSILRKADLVTKKGKIK